MVLNSFNKILSLMNFSTKYPVGNQYLDTLNNIIYEISDNNEYHFIIKNCLNDKLHKVNPNDVSISINSGLLQMITCMQ